MSSTGPTHAYQLLGVPVACENDNLIENTYYASKAKHVPETATPEERDAIVRELLLKRLAYACICSSTRRSIYHQLSKLIADTAKKPVSAKVVTVPPQVNWSDEATRASLWQAWARNILQAPVGFKAISKAKWFDATVLKGSLRYVSIGLTIKLTISLTAQFTKPNQTALSIETVRLEKQATTTGNATLFAAPDKHTEMLKNGVKDIAATAVEQLAPFVGMLRCNTKGDVPKQVEVGSTQELTAESMQRAFTDDLILDLTANLIEVAGATIEATEHEVVESLLKKYPGLANLSISVSNVETSISIPEQHTFTSDAGSIVVLQVPIAIQGYKWDQTLRYIMINLLTGSICGTAGVSKSKQGIGKFTALFKGIGKGKEKNKQKGTPADSTAPSTQVESSPPTPSTAKPAETETATAPAPATPITAADTQQPSSNVKPAAPFFINKKILGPIDSDSSSSN